MQALFSHFFHFAHFVFFYFHPYFYKSVSTGEKSPPAKNIFFLLFIGFIRRLPLLYTQR